MARGAEAFERAAEPVFDLIEHMEGEVRAGEVALAERAEAALDAFEAGMRGSSQPAHAIAPARLALAVLIDIRARAQPRLKLASWGVLVRSRLFGGRDMSLTQLRDFAETARSQGIDYEALYSFLGQIITDAQAGGRSLKRTRSHWGLFASLSVAVFLLALASYASWLEYRFHAGISAAFEQDLAGIALTPEMSRGDLAVSLGRLADARDRVRRAASSAPFRGRVRLPVVDSEIRADAAYHEAVATHAPPLMAEILEEVLATEGDSLKLYDALRALAVMRGDVDWSPGYLAGWLEDNESAFGLTGFAQHTVAFPMPHDVQIPAVDALVLDQARQFAAEASEVDRVWLELLRAPATRGLSPWLPDARVPGLSDILVRRSGLAMNTPVAGLFTQEGWAYARDFGTGVAVQTARQLASTVLGVAPQPVNQTPDLVQQRLHEETISIWTAWLADLRVEPFHDTKRAILVSGTLAQSTNPLTDVMRKVWVQMGGSDRSRPFEQQVELGRVFGPVIQYLDDGGMGRMAEVFSVLNVALSTLDRDVARGAEQLVSLRERARTIEVLRAAPRIIVQIAEDVLAQASATTGQGGADPLILRWQRAVYPACRMAIDGRYPFSAGPDAAPGEVTALLAPGGSLMQFFNAYVAQYIDVSSRPWRWKPEARFGGLSPESAAFFERAVVLSEALFDDAGQLRLQMSLAALAERGTTVLALGGQGVPVRASGAPAELVWPGPAPHMGVSVSFREGTESTDLGAPGYWGLLRMLDQFRLRFRDEGARLLVDLRSTEGRAFIEMNFGSSANPVAARPLMRDFTCPPRL